MLDDALRRNSRLGPLHGVRFPPPLFRRLLQAPDLAFQPVVLRLFKGVPPLPVLPPGGEAAALDLHAGPVQGQDVVHAAVQEIPVVGHQQKAPLFPEVRRRGPPSGGVQMVGGLVDEEIPLLPAEQRRQQALGLLPAGERVEGPVQRPGVHPQQARLPQKLPLLRRRADGAEDVQRHPGRVRHLIGEVRAGQRMGDAAAMGILPHQQPQKGGLSPAVAAQKAQLPVRVELKAHMVIDIVIAARIGKGQVIHPNQRHIHSSHVKMSRRKVFLRLMTGRNPPVFHGIQSLSAAQRMVSLLLSGAGHTSSRGTAGAIWCFSRKWKSSFHSFSLIVFIISIPCAGVKI